MKPVHILAIAAALGAIVGPASGAASYRQPANWQGDMAYNQVTGPYFDALARQCGKLGLERLSPSELLDRLDHFNNSLTKAQQAVTARAKATSCRNAIAGATCDNAGYVKAATTLAVTTRMAAAVCKAGPLPKT